jgi:uncharacterized membrane protein YfcA
MTLLLVGLIALLASGLTFVSGFGLGTLLLPAFGAFLPLEHAVALTGVVHVLNGLFKLSLVGLHIQWRIFLRFGMPAAIAAVLGAEVLLSLSNAAVLAEWHWASRTAQVTPVKLVEGLLLCAFAAIELRPSLRGMTFPPRYLMLGGVLSGFFGGLSGLQGALRSAFLVRAGLEPRSYVATGSAIGVLIDLSRLPVYASALVQVRDQIDWSVVQVAVVCACVGALFGQKWIGSMTMAGVQRIVAALLLVMGTALMVGLL